VYMLDGTEEWYVTVFFKLAVWLYEFMEYVYDAVQVESMLRRSPIRESYRELDWYAMSEADIHYCAQ